MTRIRSLASTSASTACADGDARTRADAQARAAAPRNLERVPAGGRRRVVGAGRPVGALGDERQQTEDEHDDDRPRQQPLVAALVESKADAARHAGKLCRQADLVTAP